MATVRFAARDPGAANVLACFIKRWTAAPAIARDHWTLPRATAVFGRAHISTREFPEDIAREVLERAWDQRPADALITGTSHYAPFEPVLWDIARRHHCPSLAIIDYWSNLDRRFATSRPDAVGAIDAGQAEELNALGFAPGQIIVAGQAWLSSLREQLDAPQVESDGIVAQDQAVRVLFVSEPVAHDVAIGANPAWGFDEVDSFSLLHQAACQAVQAGGTVTLAVKFHPYENPAEFKKRTEALSAVPGVTVRFLDHGEAPHEWVRWADLVAGISSVLLLESMVLGKPVVSVQPGLLRENSFLASRRGYVRTFTDRAEGRKALTALMLSAGGRECLRDGHRPFLRTIAQDAISPIADWIRKSLQQAP